MTEAEWPRSTEPAGMLRSLLDSGKASDRKLRLYGVANFRLCYGPDLQYSPTATRAVEVAERFADGLADDEELNQSSQAASDAAWYAVDAIFGHTRASEVEGAAAQLTAPSAVAAARASVVAQYEANYAEITAAQAALLRCIFGNPFRQPPPIDPSLLTWSDGLVPKLARAAYEARRLPAGTFDEARLAVLADALDEAGCTEEAVLSHLRSDGPHVRGCWAVDLLLGRP
jgi:hypothetical protein